MFNFFDPNFKQLAKQYFVEDYAKNQQENYQVEEIEEKSSILFEDEMSISQLQKSYVTGCQIQSLEQGVHVVRQDKLLEAMEKEKKCTYDSNH